MATTDESLKTVPAGEEPKVKIIIPEAVVDIKMSTGYYQKIQNLIPFLLHGKTQEEIEKAHEQLQNQDITEEWVEHYETILILCKEFEDMADKGGFIKELNVEDAKKYVADRFSEEAKTSDSEEASE